MPTQTSNAQQPGKLWCKICGITRAEDAASAQAAGADALGFNLYSQSPRYVSLDVAAELATDVSCQTVALVVNPSSEEVDRVLATGRFDLLQFHGDEPAEFCEQFAFPYLKAHRVGKPDADGRAVPLAEVLREFENAWALLLDAYTRGVKGGTGQQFDWSLWPCAVEDRAKGEEGEVNKEGKNPPLRLVLAGGLDATNVVQAIEQTRPWGVDLSGGVEGPVKGVKDPGKMMEFVRLVRSAERLN